MPVDKLRAVVGIKPLYGKGYRLSHFIKTINHHIFSFSEYCPTLHPCSENICLIHCISELPFCIVAGMGDRIHFCPPRALYVPVVGSYGNMMLQQRPRLCAAINSPANLSLPVFEPAVYLPGTDRNQLFLQCLV